MDEILHNYQNGGMKNEALYNQNLELQMEIEELELHRLELEKDIKMLRERNNEFEKVKKDDVLEKYNVRGA